VTLRQAVLFVGSNALTMWVLQPLAMVAAQNVSGIPLMGAKALALCGSVVANFLLYRYVVWRREPVEVTPSPLPAGPSGAPAAARR
jgi:putative flippase GtrA